MPCRSSAASSRYAAASSRPVARARSEDTVDSPSARQIAWRESIALCERVLESRTTIVETHTLDAPFIFESLKNYFRRQNLRVFSAVHPIFSVRRQWERIVAGELSPQTAWATGRLSVSGDMRLAQRVRSLLAF